MLNSIFEWANSENKTKEEKFFHGGLISQLQFYLHQPSISWGFIKEGFNYDLDLLKEYLKTKITL